LRVQGQCSVKPLLYRCVPVASPGSGRTGRTRRAAAGLPGLDPGAGGIGERPSRRAHGGYKIIEERFGPRLRIPVGAVSPENLETNGQA
jgi:hypothetical protein